MTLYAVSYVSERTRSNGLIVSRDFWKEKLLGYFISHETRVNTAYHTRAMHVRRAIALPRGSFEFSHRTEFVHGRHYVIKTY